MNLDERKETARYLISIMAERKISLYDAKLITSEMNVLLYRMEQDLTVKEIKGVRK